MAMHTPHNVDDELEKKIVAWFSTSHTPDEEKVMLRWIHDVPERKQLYDEIKRMWEMVGAYKVNDPPEAIWQNISARLETKRKPSRVSRPLVFAFRAAAVVVVAFGLYLLQAHLRLGGVLWNSVEEKEAVTANGQRLEVRLPDGTVVQLNAGSRLRYPERFAGTARDVSLDGEAYFEVEEDETPFVVHTAIAVVKDLGTEFNIRARGEEVAVVVKSGKVAVRSLGSVRADEVQLHADEMSSVARGRSPSLPRKIEVGRYLAWRTGALVFERRPLSDVCEELTRQYNVRVEVMDSSLTHQTLTGTFSNKPLEYILSDICLTLDLKYKKREQGMVIFR